MSRHTARCQLVVLLVFAAAGTCFADEGFRVENRVLAGKRELGSTTTLFFRGAAYDFAPKNAIVTIFDPAQAEYVLLDPDRRIQVRLSFDEVSTFVAELKDQASRYPNEMLRFQADPEMEQKYDARHGVLHLDSPWLTYEVTTVDPPNQSVTAEYLAFCDGIAKLNAHVNAGSSPPFARLAVNAALATKARLPAKIVRTAYPSKSSRRGGRQVRSEHTFYNRLSAAEQARIAEVQRQRGEFAKVGLADFYPPSD